MPTIAVVYEVVHYASTVDEPPTPDKATMSNLKMHISFSFQVNFSNEKIELLQFTF